MAVTTSSGNGFALYSGVKLPVYPDIDLSSFPYVGIAHNLYYDKYSIYFTDSVFEYHPEANAIGTVTQTRMSVFNLIDGSWETVYSNITVHANFYVNLSDTLKFIYSNYDVYSDTGDLYLAASDPIPLDGMNVIEWDGDTTGLTQLQGLWKVAEYLPQPATVYSVYLSLNDVLKTNHVITDRSSYGVGAWSMWSSPSDSIIAVLSISGDNAIGASSGLYFSKATNGPYTKLLAYPAPPDISNEPIITETSGDGFMLYKGLKLPKLDSIWTDKSDYVFICKAADNSGSSYFAIVSTVAPYHDSVNGGISLNSPFYFRQYGCFTDEALANQYGTTAYTWTYYQDHSLNEGLSNFKQTVMWTSEDIRKDSDGSIFLAASEPIPLDGMSVIEWNGGTEGLYNPQGGLYRVGDHMIKPTAAYSVYWNDFDGFRVNSVIGVNPQFGSEGWYMTDGLYNSTIAVASASADNPGGFNDGLYFIRGTDNRTLLLAYIPAANDITPVYKRISGTWVKQTAYNRLSGEWVLISTS